MLCQLDISISNLDMFISNYICHLRILCQFDMFTLNHICHLKTQSQLEILKLDCVICTNAFSIRYVLVKLSY